MDSFYDREAGVAWGPMTKQEMLDDVLLRGKRKVKRRFTSNCNPSFNDDKEERFLQIMHSNSDLPNDNSILILSSDDEIEERTTDQRNNRTNKSSHYNDSLDESNVQNHEESQFIDSLKENTRSTYDNLNEVDVVGNEVWNLELKPDIQNRLPTPANLDEYTYDNILDLDEEKDVLVSDNITNKCDQSDDSLHKRGILHHYEELRFIDDLNKSAVNLYNYPASYNNMDGVNLVCSEVSNLHLPPDIQNRSPTPENLDEHAYNSLEEDKIVLGSTENLPSCSNSNHDTYMTQYCHTPEKDRSLSEERSQCFPDTSHEETGNNVSGNRLEDSSLLNDTIAEMERLLNEGLKTMKTEKHNKENMENDVNCGEFGTPGTSTNANPYTPTPIVPTINIIPSSEIKGSGLHCGSNYNTISTKSAIKKLPKKNIVTKIPVVPSYAHNTKPFAKPTLTPTNHNKHNFNTSSAPTSLKKRFKNIESPISVYIKNSGMTPLYKKITPSKPLTSNKKKNEATKANKENSIVFPEVVYKPAKRAIITKSDDFKLPSKIESLIPQKSNVIKHERRIGIDGTRKDCVLINEKLSDVDLTMDSNASLDSLEDISIRHARRAYIK